MRNLFLIMSCVLLVALSTSCAKDCQCTRFEDGEKVSITSSAAMDTKYFDEAYCEMLSEIEYKEDICKVNCYNEVGLSPKEKDYMKDGVVDYEAYGKAYEAWAKAILDCRESNTKKDVKVKVECKLH